MSLPNIDAASQLIIVLYLDLYSFGLLTRHVVDLAWVSSGVDWRKTAKHTSARVVLQCSFAESGADK